MRSMDRVVTEYEVSESGSLRPVRYGAWRVERARGEASLHRRLAALRPTPKAIARAASRYGPLRLHADLLSIFPAGFWGEVAVVTAQDGATEWADVGDWLARGCRGAMPPALRKAMPLIQVIAGLPPEFRAYAKLFLENAPRQDRIGAVRVAHETLGDWDPSGAISEMTDVIDRVAAAGGPDALLAAADQGAPTPCEDPALAWAIGFYASAVEVIAGREMPVGVDVGDGLSTLVGATPDLLRSLETFDGGGTEIGRLIAHLRHEAVDDWCSVAGEMARWVEAIDLHKRADSEELNEDDQEVLDHLVVTLLDGSRVGLEGATLAGELAERVLPRLRSRLDRRLEQLGAWPYPADRPIGTYARALWAVRGELNDERPPQRCAVGGCRQTFPAHGNRLYCDSHRLTRDRERKREA